MTFEKVHQAKLDFAAGKLNADAHGYLHVPGHGDIKLSSEFVASVGRSRPTGKPSTTARARWDAAVEAELVVCRGNRKRAVQAVARRSPALRQQLVAEANGKQSARTQQPAARRPVASVSKEHFQSQVDRLVSDGMSKHDAVKQLSISMGLSQPRETGSYWESGRQRYSN